MSFCSDVTVYVSVYECQMQCSFGGVDLHCVCSDIWLVGFAGYRNMCLCCLLYVGVAVALGFRLVLLRTCLCKGGSCPVWFDAVHMVRSMFDKLYKRTFDLRNVG